MLISIHVRTPNRDPLPHRGDPQRVPAHWQQTHDGREVYVPEQVGEVLGWHYDRWEDGAATHILRCVAVRTADEPESERVS